MAICPWCNKEDMAVNFANVLYGTQIDRYICLNCLKNKLIGDGLFELVNSHINVSFCICCKKHDITNYEPVYITTYESILPSAYCYYICNNCFKKYGSLESLIKELSKKLF